MSNFARKPNPWLAVFILTLGLSAPVSAAETDLVKTTPDQIKDQAADKPQKITLPNPLTLDYVLAHALNEHPQIQMQQRVSIKSELSSSYSHPLTKLNSI